MIENSINYNKLITDTPLLSVGWKNDMANQVDVKQPAAANTVLTDELHGL